MSERVHYAHAVAEDTKLAGESFDLASLCLIAHELPSAATRCDDTRYMYQSFPTFMSVTCTV